MRRRAGAAPPFSVDVPWGDGARTIRVSTRERALFEVLDGVPRSTSFEHAGLSMESLFDLPPRRLDFLLRRTRSVKINRFFFRFSDREGHMRAKRLDSRNYDLGRGKRVLARGGRPNTESPCRRRCMDRTNPFSRQAELVVRILPSAAKHEEFALKGGTAINFFLRDMPRLSVDIDPTGLLRYPHARHTPEMGRNCPRQWKERSPARMVSPKRRAPMRRRRPPADDAEGHR